MGTDEYAKFCSLIGAGNFLCINGGTGTKDDGRNWVEYCNGEEGTYYLKYHTTNSKRHYHEFQTTKDNNFNFTFTSVDGFYARW